LVSALRNGDEAAFLTLVGRYQRALVRLALIFAPNPTTAEDADQETWLDVLQGILRFDDHTSLKLWSFRLLVDRLTARGVYTPFAPELDAPSSAPAAAACGHLPVRC
jgi:RNA polymerase sigma-70 factor (ECF subfamily)